MGVVNMEVAFSDAREAAAKHGEVLDLQEHDANPNWLYALIRIGGRDIIATVSYEMTQDGPAICVAW